MGEQKKTSIDHTIAEIQDFGENKDRKVQFSYLGAFDEENLMIINQYIEFAQSVNLISKRTDLFRIFVELTQNISQNSTLTKEIAGKQVGCGKLTIIEYDTVFLIVAGNPANEADAKELEKRGKEINGKSQEELREYKRIKMRELIKKSENGNIGLIKTAMISNNELDIVSKKVGEDEYYVSITVKLNKD